MDNTTGILMTKMNTQRKSMLIQVLATEVQITSHLSHQLSWQRFLWFSSAPKTKQLSPLKFASNHHNLVIM